MQPAPCGADITVLVPLGAALGTTDELAELTDELSPLALDEQLRHLDPANPRWHDPAAHELRAHDVEPDEPDFPNDTRWTYDLDDPYTWLDLKEPTSTP